MAKTQPDQNRRVMVSPEVQRQTARILLLFFVSLYLLTGRGYIYHTDEEAMYLVTKNLVTRGQVDIQTELLRAANARPGQEGKAYSFYGLGQSLAAAPLFSLGHTVARFLPAHLRIFAERFCTCTLNAFLTALTVVVLFLIGCRLGCRLEAAVTTAALFGVGTLAWPYAKMFFNQPLVGLCLATATYVLIGEMWSGSVRVFVAGSCMGLAFLTRYESLVAVVPFLWFASRRRGSGAGGSLRVFLGTATLFLSAMAPFLLVSLWYNHARFGSAWETGYTTFVNPHEQALIWLGLYTYLVSPLSGVFLYSPTVVLGLTGLPQLRRSHPNLWGLVSLVAALYLLTVARLPFGGYGGGGPWGPRYLLPVLPLLMVPVMVLFDQGFASVRTKACVAVIAGLGILVQLLAVVVNPGNVYEKSVTEIGEQMVAVRSPWFCPLVEQARQIPSISLQRIGRSSLTAQAIHGRDFKEQFKQGIDFWHVHCYRLGMSPLYWLVPALLLTGVLLTSGLKLGRMVLTVPPPAAAAVRGV